MPNTPNFVRSNFSLFRAIGQTASPFTGKIRTQEYDAVFWQADVTLPPLNRTQAVEWQSFLMQLQGTTNYFKFADPDALTNQGDFNTTHLLGDKRVDNTNVSLSFSGNTITAGASTFLMSPAVFGWNNDGTPSTTVYAKVTNKEASTSRAITVTLTLIEAEA